MPRFKDEEIAAYYVDQEIVCKECLTNEESRELSANDIITTNEIENSGDMYFCNRCKKKI